MSGIRFKKAIEPATPAASRVEFWFDATKDSLKYKLDTGESFSVVSNADLEVAIGRVLTLVCPTTFQTRYVRDTFILTPTDIQNGYVILTEKAVTNSITATIDRLALIEGIDFLSINTVDNKTKINFTSQTFIARSSQEELVEGAVLSIHYAVQ